MRKILIIFLGVIVSGCVSMEIEPQDAVLTGKVVEVVVIEPSAQKAVASETTSIEKVYLGMSERDVSRIMGDEMVVGYQKNIKTGVLEKINMGTIYKTETLKAGEKVYLIKYYFTSINKADGIISEDELTPLVFEENRLVGSGWTFLFRLKNELSF
ncbi:MAG: DUF3192 domain-containing protein [Candidatus Omnitrophica bacterium]|nr:DUF3192 domain-containing protein [Candidatus Omnitrophota bacterium]MBU1997737.1 DUF3192 domain-containing protein [Candidatus Omnitrophota bacterium]MBU4333650.1 DUF3192 domain-containing protein [Candidatus Omnitrophota bacterium]